MLEELNKLFSESAERIVCRNSVDNSQESIASMRAEVVALQIEINKVEASNWLLTSENTYLFAVGLLALLGLNKQIVICANQQEEWLNKINQSFDAVLSDKSTDVKNRKQVLLSLRNSEFSKNIDIRLSTQAADINRLTFSGNEKIRFFTSGSTGEAKSIDKTLNCFINEVITLENTFTEKAQDSLFVASVSHMHIYGLLFKVIWPLLTNRCWLNEVIDYPEQIVTISRNNPSLLFISSPAFLSRLDLDLEKISLNSFSSGGPLKLDAARLAEEYFGELPIEVYGSTETGGIGYRQQSDESTRWTLFENIRLQSTKDEVLLYSPHLDIYPPVVLDDQLTILSNDEFMLNGRKDRIVKLGEKRISLNEIENYLKSFSTVEDCVSLLVPGNRDVIGCVIVLTDEGKVVSASSGRKELIDLWKKRLNKRFESVTIPRKWRMVESVPVNAQSKIDAIKLLSLFDEQELNAK